MAKKKASPKPAPKAAPKAAAKPTPKAAPKPAPKAAPKPAPKAASNKPAPKPAPKPTPKPVPKSAPKPAAAQEPKVPAPPQPVEPTAIPPTNPTEPQPEGTAAPTAEEAEAVARIPRLWRLGVEWVNRDLKWALFFSGLGFAISWVANVVIVAGGYDGFGKIPPGAPVTTPTTPITGSIFWAVGMAVLMGLLAYRRQVGGQRFWADVRNFPSGMVKLLQADGQGALGHILWGFAGAMLAATLVSAPVSAMLGAGVLVLLTVALRPLLTGLVMVAWRKIIGKILPNRAAPPAELTLSVVMIGSVIALGAGLGFPDPTLKLVLAIAAGVVAFVVTTRAATPAVSILLLGGAAMAVVGVATVVPALASDGGWRECGATLTAWLQCGGRDVMQHSLLAGLLGAGGGLLGGGLGTVLPNDPPPRKGWDAWAHGLWDGSINQLAFLGNRDVTTPLFAIKGFGDNFGPWLASEEGKGVAREFAKDPLAFANKRGLGQWLTDFPGQEHGPITAEDRERYSALLKEYQDAKARGDDYNVSRLQGMAMMTTAWMVGSMVDPETAAEGAITKLTGRGLGGAAEHLAVGELEQALLGHVPGELGLDAEQRDFINKRLKGWTELVKTDPRTGQVIPSVNKVYTIEFTDGSKGVFKPTAGQDPGGTLVKGVFDPEFFKAEIAAHHLDRQLGFDLVPTTAVIDHPDLGRGSIQRFAADEGKVASAYSVEDQQKMAVLDYILGNGDRHDGNIMSQGSRPAAIDHGMSLPNKGDTAIRSDFVAAHANEALHADVLAGVDRVDQHAFAEQLRAGGVSEDRIQGALDRLNEIKTNRQITTASFDRDIRSANNQYMLNNSNQLLHTQTFQEFPKTVLLRH